MPKGRPVDLNTSLSRSTTHIATANSRKGKLYTSIKMLNS
uniref:Uncharacterized protein n=1 Tax=Rhizophora mucronata TaxID=61149 RepID=A0A2P2PLY4_RHIMU